MSHSVGLTELCNFCIVCSVSKWLLRFFQWQRCLMVRTSLSLNVGTLDVSHISLQEGCGDALVSLLAARWSCVTLKRSPPKPASVSSRQSIWLRCSTGTIDTIIACAEKCDPMYGLRRGVSCKVCTPNQAWNTLQCLQKADIPGPRNPRRRDCWPEDGIDFMHGLGTNVE